MGRRNTSPKGVILAVDPRCQTDAGRGDYASSRSVLPEAVSLGKLKKS